MIIFIVPVISILIAMMRGGKLGYLADLNIRWRGFIILGFLLQVLIYNDFWQGRDELRAWTPLGYILSLCLLTIALAVNYRIPGMPFIALGFFLNFITILANGGYMPAAPSAYVMAGFRNLSPGQVYNNSIGMGAETPLFFLGDVFAIPKQIPFHNVFSIGDGIIVIGAAYLLQIAMMRKIPQPASN